ncbi:MAG: ABC transporter permease, partial [Rhodospirillales bacterium]|nr:ABC transporter permease [Rhodospirillales bacterium]
MLRFVVWRLIHVVPVLLGVSFVVFSVLYLIPGDIAHTLLSMFYTEERAALLREELGLDRPMFVQYGHWLWAALHGDLGQSLMMRMPVMTVLLDKTGNSLILT